MNWSYIGTSDKSKLYIDQAGHAHHERTVSPTGVKKHFGVLQACHRQDQTRDIVIQPGKHIYLFPPCDAVRPTVDARALPYPKRPKDSSEPPGNQPGEGGAAPTRTLHLTGV